MPASRVAHAELFKSVEQNGELDETMHNVLDKTDGTSDNEREESKSQAGYDETDVENLK